MLFNIGWIDILVQIALYFTSLASLSKTKSHSITPTSSAFGTGLRHEKRQKVGVELKVFRDEQFFNILYTNISIGAPTGQTVKLRLSQNGRTWVPASDPASTPCTFMYSPDLESTPDSLPFIVHRDTNSRLIGRRIGSVLKEPVLVTHFRDDCRFDNRSGTYDSGKSKGRQGAGEMTWTWKSDDSTLDEYFANGDLVIDTITVDSATQRMYLGAATNYTAHPQLGLGLGSVELDLFKTDPRASFVETFSTNNEVTSYSLYLNDFDQANNHLTVGTVDVEKYKGNLTTLKTFYKEGTAAPLVDIEKIEFFDGTSSRVLLSNITGCLGFGTEVTSNLESSSGSLFGRNNFPNAIYKILGSFGDSFGQKQQVLCTERFSGKYMIVKLSDIEVKIDASHFLIPAFNTSNGDPILGPDGKQLCNVMVSGFPRPTFSPDFDVILGVPFLQAVYTVFDHTNNETSIAPAVFNATKKNLVPLKKGGVKDTPGLVHLEQDNLPKPTRIPKPTGSPGDASTPRAPGKVPKKVVIEGIVAGVVGGGVLLALLYLVWNALLKRHRKRRNMKPKPDVIMELPGETRIIKELHDTPRVMGELPGSFPPLVELPADCTWGDTSSSNSNISRPMSARTASSSRYSQASHQSIASMKSSSSWYSQGSQRCVASSRSPTVSAGAPPPQNWI